MSMFGAGDLNSPEPYGLSPTEKAIVDNKKTIDSTDKKVDKLQSEVRTLNQSLEGLQSIIEGESNKLNKISKELVQDTSQADFDREKINKNTESIKALEAQLAQNTENINTIKSSLDQLVNTVNAINKAFVSRDDFKELLSAIEKKEKIEPKKEVSKSNKLSNKSNYEHMQNVRAWFKKDYFTKAIPVIEYLIEKNYRPAENNYYLGEINYYRKNYKDALHYFKTSMMLYDKASWLPKLLLHSAISFEKLGDNTNAQSFYSTLVDIYPESPEAKEASKKIK
jgi:TolA-binding protein